MTRRWAYKSTFTLPLSYVRRSRLEFLFIEHKTLQAAIKPKRQWTY